MMRKQILAALLLFVLTVIGACTGGPTTKSCLITGLTAGHIYYYAYEDANGQTINGFFEASGATAEIPNVDSSVDCASFDVLELVLM